MKRLILFLSVFILFGTIFAEEKSKFLYCKIPPFSLEKQCAFYNLYPEHKKVFERLGFLLNSSNPLLIKTLSNTMISSRFSSSENFSDEQIACLDNYFSFLYNRRLPGNRISSKEQLLALNEEDIDLGLALILSEKNFPPRNDFIVKKYEIFLDLLTAQVSAYLKAFPKYTDEQIVECINKTLFQDNRFKYPLQKDMYSDKYTFLSSVIDGKFGICLGTSVLFLSIAQRLNLPLEIITPPGHIYLRLKKSEGEFLNIETTSFGKHLDTEDYIHEDESDLQQKSLKEVIGLTFSNRATFYLRKHLYREALEAYREALYYCDSSLIKESIGFCLVLCGQGEEGKLVLQEVLQEGKASSLVSDYLENNVSLTGLKAMFLSPGTSKEKIEKYSLILKEIQRRNPKFQEGYNRLAAALVNLGRYKEAIKELENLYEIVPEDVNVLHYLVELSLHQMNHEKAEKYYKELVETIKKTNKEPRFFKKLRFLVENSIYALHN